MTRGACLVAVWALLWSASVSAQVSTITSPTFVDRLLEVTLGAPGAPVTADRNAIWVRYDGFDAVSTSPPLWSVGALFRHVQAGGNGNRNALWALLEVDGGVRDAGTFSTALQAFTFGSVPGGAYVGSNPYVRVSGLGSGSGAIGEEINLDAQVPLWEKIGLQVADVTTSTGQGLHRSAALRLVNQPGAAGFRDGILFDHQPQQSLTPGNSTLLRTTGGVYGTGIDLGAASFVGAGMVLPMGTYYAARDAYGVPRGLVTFNSHGQIALGGGYYGAGWVAIPATGAPPLPGPHMDGVITIDPTRGLIWYAGGQRYRVAGTVF